MACIPFQGGMICGVPDATGTVTARGREWPFTYTDSPGGGPLWRRRNNGEPLSNQNVPRAVWDAFGVWLRTYRGLPAVEAVEPERIVHIVGHHYFETTADDPRSDEEIRAQLLAVVRRRKR